MIEICTERRAEHAAEDEVRFERSIDARSARIEFGLIMYETINVRNEISDRGARSKGESDRLTSARKASCAMFSWSRQSSFRSLMISDSFGGANPPVCKPEKKMLL